MHIKVILGQSWQWAALLAGALLGAATLLSDNPILLLALLLGLTIPLVALVRTERGIRWLLVTVAVADVLKRLMYVFPIPFDMAPYLVLLLPDAVLLGLLVNRLLLLIRGDLKWRATRADIPVALFSLYCVLVTLSNTDIPLLARLASLENYILPMMLYWVTVTMHAYRVGMRRLTRLYVTLSIFAAVYALIQSRAGLLPFERVWAEFTRDTSITAFDVTRLSSLYGFFRSFSIFSDHMTFGYFEAVAMMFLLTGLTSSRFHKRWRPLLLMLQCAGLFLSLVRATWLFAATALGLFVLLRARWGQKTFQHPALIVALLMLSALGTYFLSDALYAGAPSSTSESILDQRILQRGTLSDRVTGWPELLSSPTSFPVWGKGLADLSFYGRKFGFETTYSGAHNFVVELIERLGWLGFGLFVWLLYRFLSEAKWALVNPSARNHNRMWFAIVLAFLVASNFSRAVFFTGKATAFTFWLGIGYLSQQGALHRTSQAKPRLRSSEVETKDSCN